MRLIETLLVRDEVDIIERHLDFHLNHGVDFVIVTDNGSADGTREILLDYEKMGWAHVIDEPPSDFSQGLWVTRMARLAAVKYRGDWVVNADADELFIPAAGHPASIKEVLERVDDQVWVLEVPRHDFVQIAGEPPLDPASASLRKKVSLNVAGRPLPPKAVHRAHPEVCIAQGNHGARYPDPTCGTTRETNELAVYHYPVRGYGQFESKVRNGGSGYAQNTRHKPGIGFHKRQWYQKLQEGKLYDEYVRLCVDPSSTDLVEDDSALTYLKKSRPLRHELAPRSKTSFAQPREWLSRLLNMVS